MRILEQKKELTDIMVCHEILQAADSSARINAAAFSVKIQYKNFWNRYLFRDFP